MTSPVVSGAQGDGGRMDDETLAELQRLAQVSQPLIVTNSDGTETWPDLAAVNAWDHARSELSFAAAALVAELVATRRELGDTRAENETLKASLSAMQRTAVEQIQGTASDMAAAGETMLKRFSDEMNDRLIAPLIAERDDLAARLGDTRARLARAAVIEREARTVMDYLAVHGPRVVCDRLAAALGATDQAGDGG